jgi:hypothetical protein
MVKKQITFLLAGVILAFTFPSAQGADAQLAALSRRPQDIAKAAFLAQPTNTYRVPPETEAIRRWKLSIVPLLASQALDVASSHGKFEGNALLASPNGRFGAKASLMKLGVVGAVLGVEYLVIRKNPRAAKMLWKLNWGSSAVTGAVAARNYSIQ